MAHCIGTQPAMLFVALMLPMPVHATPPRSDPLRPVFSASEIRRLAKQLGDRKFQVREQASRRLERLGPAAYPLFRKLMRTHPDAEVRRRAARLLLIPARQREAAAILARRLLPLIETFCEDDVYEIEQGPLIAHGIRGLYERLHEPLPDALSKRLLKAAGFNPEACARLLRDGCLPLIERGHSDSGRLFDAFVQASLGDLDPYCAAKSNTGFINCLRALVAGVGLELATDPVTGTIRVVTPQAGSPAWRAGIRAGDHIDQLTLHCEQNGTPLAKPRVVPTAGLTVSQMEGLLVGPPGTRIGMKIKQAGTGVVRVVDLVRRRVAEETVLGCWRELDGSWQYWIDGVRRIGYVRLTRFGTTTAADLTRVLEQLKQGGVRALVLDLRFCPGGLFSGTVEIANRFLRAGRIVTIKPRNVQAVSYAAEATEYRLGVPLVCLVNRKTARAAELLAACLQDNGRAILIGERTQGQGCVQNIQPIDDYDLKLTTALFLRPSGKKLDRMRLPGHDPDEWGVRPDRGFAIGLSAVEYRHVRMFLEQQRFITRQPGRRPVDDRALTAGLRALRERLERT